MPETTRPYSEAQARERLKDLPGWELDEGAIKRVFRPPSFFASMMLANAVAQLAETAQHHPDIAISYRQVTLKLSTHSANGLTDKDFALARKISDVLDWKPEPPLG